MVICALVFVPEMSCMTISSFRSDRGNMHAPLWPSFLVMEGAAPLSGSFLSVSSQPTGVSPLGHLHISLFLNSFTCHLYPESFPSLLPRLTSLYPCCDAKTNKSACSSAFPGQRPHTLSRDHQNIASIFRC